MDIIELIRKQIKEAHDADNTLLGLNSVLTHIERAEFLLNKAEELEEDHLYTDVVYRTNHAFEGILKEAFQILAEHDSENKTPYEIENYLLDNSILNERVIELLKNYRQDWRNPSTHDYNLFFGYSEAFLAIVSISAFVHVLLNQIVEKIYYDKEKESIKRELSKIKDGIENDFDKYDLLKKTQNMLLGFAKRNVARQSEDDRLSRYVTEILGSLTAFIESLDESIKIESEPILKIGDRRLRPDLIVEKSNEKVLIEFKVVRREHTAMMNRKILEDQLLSYLIHTKIGNGILFIIPDEMNETDEYDSVLKELEIGSEKFRMLKIHPKRH
ncbi:MAG: hypothetical protein SVM80_09190 [Halobacteriota archaeon]|nr:hypothetical protein [Halobacteriota archaeon]